MTTILTITDIPPIEPVHDLRHPTLRAVPPLQPPVRHTAVIGGRVVEYLGDAPPTQVEVDTFVAAEAVLVVQRARVTEIGADVSAFTFGGQTLAGLKAMTRDEFKTWWAANITTFAQANVVLRWLAMAALHRFL